MAAERLLIVDECFAAPGGKVMVTPRLKVAVASREPFAVRLVRPGGETREATAALDFAHIQGPLPPFAMMRLLDVAPAEVPPGTEIWTT